MLRRSLIVLILLWFGFQFLARASTSAVVINEVLYNPTGTDTGLEWIELFNPTCDSLDLTGYQVSGASGSYYTFGVFTLPARQFVTIHWRADGTDTLTDLFTGSVDFPTNIGNTSGYVAIFNSSVHTKDTIVDYLEYGAAGQAWESAAVDGGIWTTGTFIGNVLEGVSLGRTTDGVDTNAITDWSSQTLLTPGSGNDLIDDAICVSPTLTEVPTPTPTPLPTETPLPTPTNIPTSIPTPPAGGSTPTSTPVPTATTTPVLTSTPTSTPTVTPIPTNTPVPTETPLPTLANTPTVTLTLTPVVTPIPTLTNTPIPTVTLTATPTKTPTPVATLTPTTTPTSTPSPTPTVTSTLQVEWSLPSSVEVGKGFAIEFALTNGGANQTYAVKFEASEDGKDWYDGKTLGLDGKTYFSWNSPWAKLPTVTTDSNWVANSSIMAMIKPDAASESYKVRLKFNRLIDGKITTSLEKVINGISMTITPTVAPVPSVTPVPTGWLTVTPVPTTNPTITPTPKPLPQLIKIDQLRKLLKGLVVIIRGIITSGRGVFGGEMLYIQDQGKGVKIVIPEDVGTVDFLKAGNQIEAVGTIGEAYSESYLKVAAVTDVKLLDQNGSLAPTVIKTGSIGEDHEGSLVLVNGKVVSTSGDTFFIDDGSGKVKVLIRETTGIDKPYMRVGYYVQVRGIVSQYKDEYRILPRAQTDLIVSKTPIKSGDVLGAFDNLDQLPQTGSEFGVFAAALVLVGLGFRGLASLIVLGQKYSIFQ